MSISLASSLPPRPTATTSPPTAAEHYAALSALHTHYRALVAAERDTMVRERQLWEDERKLYVRRIEELESAAATAPPPPAPAPPQPVEWSPPAHQPATREWAPPPYLATAAVTVAGSQQQQENSRPAPAASQPPPPSQPQPAATNNNSNNNNSNNNSSNANSKPVLALDDDDDDDDEISPEEMAQLLREATRIVYPISRMRPRGRSLAEPARGRQHPAHAQSHAPHHDSEAEDGSGEEEVELKLKKTSNFGMDFGKWR